MAFKISIIGSGNVAEYLASTFYRHQVEVVEICGRNLECSKIICEEVGATYIDDASMMSDQVDAIIIAVSDAQIEEVANKLNGKKCLVAHTAGSVDMNVLLPFIKHVGVFYPLQTFTKNIKPTYLDFPFYLEGNSNEATGKLKLIASTISHNVNEANSKQRRALHLAAVFANNFVNHLLSIANDIVEDEDLNFAHLVPLIYETVYKAHLLSPNAAQTGPASRHDENTIANHQKILEDKFPQHLEVYNKLTQSILNKYNS